MRQPYPINTHVSRPQWALVVMVLVAAAVARFGWISAAEAHFDELWHMKLSAGRGAIADELPANVLLPEAPDVTSIASANGPWYRVWTHLDGVTHPPLYPLLLRAWRSAFGESVPVARMLGALASVLAVAAFFDVLRLLHGTRVALWGAAILALSAAQVAIAQEVRNYSVTLLWLLLAADALVRIETVGPSPRRFATLGVATTLALFSHYFAAPALVAMGLYALVRLRARARIGAIAAMSIALVVFAVAWGPFMTQQTNAVVEASAKGSLGEAAASPRVLALVRLGAMPLRQLFEVPDPARMYAASSIILLVVAWILLWRRRDLLLWGFWSGAFVIFLGTLDLVRQTRHLEQLRHTIFIGPAVVALVAALTSAARGRFVVNALPCAALIAGAAALLVTRYLGPADDNPHFSQIGQLVATAPHERTPVVFYSDPHVSWFARLLYMGTAHYSKTFPRPAAVLDAPASPQLLGQLKRLGPEVWLVRGPGALSENDLLPGSVPVERFEQPGLAYITLLNWPDRGPSHE